jgi:hypothetical protein
MFMAGCVIPSYAADSAPASLLPWTSKVCHRGSSTPKHRLCIAIVPPPRSQAARSQQLQSAQSAHDLADEHWRRPSAPASTTVESMRSSASVAPRLSPPAVEITEPNGEVATFSAESSPPPEPAPPARPPPPATIPVIRAAADDGLEGQD